MSGIFALGHPYGGHGIVQSVLWLQVFPRAFSQNWIFAKKCFPLRSHRNCSLQMWTWFNSFWMNKLQFGWEDKVVISWEKILQSSKIKSFPVTLLNLIRWVLSMIVKINKKPCSRKTWWCWRGRRRGGLGEGRWEGGADILLCPVAAWSVGKFY